MIVARKVDNDKTDIVMIPVIRPPLRSSYTLQLSTDIERRKYVISKS